MTAIRRLRNRVDRSIYAVRRLGVYFTCGSISIALIALDDDVKAKNLIYRINYTLLEY